MELQKFKDAISVAATGQTAAEGKAAGLCIQCKEPALPKCSTEAGRREYAISGFCEQCWDALFANNDDEQEVHTLTELQYAKPEEGQAYKLYIFDVDGFHSGAQWFRNTVQYEDEEVTTAKAREFADSAIAQGKEVRICDGGDMIVFHAKDGVVVYPESGQDFWAAVEAK